jgi:hypothetical protein
MKPICDWKWVISLIICISIRLKTLCDNIDNTVYVIIAVLLCQDRHTQDVLFSKLPKLLFARTRVADGLFVRAVAILMKRCVACLLWPAIEPDRSRSLDQIQTTDHLYRKIKVTEGKSKVFDGEEREWRICSKLSCNNDRPLISSLLATGTDTMLVGW